MISLGREKLIITNNKMTRYDAVIFNERGAVAPRSYPLLQNNLCLSRRKIELLRMMLSGDRYLGLLQFKKLTFVESYKE